MKGFVKIFESVLACLIILASMTFFFAVSSPASNWNDIVLRDRINDVVLSMANNGSLAKFIQQNNVTEINNTLRMAFPSNIDYSAEVSGIPNPVIYLGCNCTSSEINELGTMLQPYNSFPYRERNISIRIEPVWISNIRNGTNILFLIGYHNLNTYKSQIDKFLERGGTVFVLGDLTQIQVNDGFMNTYFKLKWTEDNAQERGGFYDGDKNTSEYRIVKYFVNISSYGGNIQFRDFHTENGENDVNQIDVDGRTVIVSNNGKTSLLKTNWFVSQNGLGRTVWLADYDHSKDQNNKLLKAAIMWASGERYRVDPFFSRKTMPVSYLRTNLVGVLDGFEPFEFSLTVWRIYY